MATWLTHLRIAQKIKERIPGISLPYLMIGSIAPDSGLPDGNAKNYNPPKEITHFKTKLSEDQSKIDLDAFFNKYLSPSKFITRSDNTRSFLWGYYFHLIADSIWINKYMLPYEKAYNEEPHPGKDFADFMREEIYALDFQYFQQNGTDLLDKFKNIKVDVNFFNEFESSYIQDSQNRIIEYYQKQKYILDRDFRFYSSEKIEEFIDEASKTCIDILI